MNSAKILYWNCRGISAGDTSRILKLIKTLKPFLVCLVETRGNSDRVNRFCKKIPRHWEWAFVLTEGFSGGIFILWSSSISQVTPIAVSHCALHVVVSTTFSKPFIISIVYNSSRCFNQHFLWHELSKLSHLRLPWLILGDFNSILPRIEHKGGTFFYYCRKLRFSMILSIVIISWT